MQFLEKPWKKLESRDIKFVTAGKRRNYLVPEPNLTTNFFFWNSVINLGLSILELNKIVV